MSDTRPPRHAFELEIRIGGEDWASTMRELERFTAHVRKHGPDCSLASGGGGTSGDIRIDARDITPKAYREELDVWWKQQRRDRKEARNEERN